MQEDSLDAVLREQSKPRYLRKLAQKRNSAGLVKSQRHPDAEAVKALLFINNIDLSQIDSTLS